MTCFNINFEPDRKDVLNRIHSRCKGESGYVCVVDGNVLSRTHADPAYLKVIQGSMFSIVDSSWIPLFVKWIHGLSWKQYCGSDIFKDITTSKSYRQFFLGSTNEILSSLKIQLTEIDASINDMCFEELPFSDVDDFNYQAIADTINSDGPDIVWLSLGAPKQEVFASRLAPLLNHGIVIPVGAVFNFRSGISYRRAPGWMTRHHLEFLYRIFTEPSKQLKRCWLIVKSIPSILLEEKRKVQK